MNENNLKNTVVLLQDNLGDDRNSMSFQWYSLTLDIIESEIFKPTIYNAKRKARANICKISFLNEGVKLINITIFFMIHW